MIITIGNNKGGVGKTSITCNLGVALGRLGKKVLIVDLDSQCNTTSIISGKENIDFIASLYELISSDSKTANIENIVFPTRHKNVYLVPNIEESSALDIPLGKELPNSLFILKNKMRDFAINNFDFTLIDNPPTIGLWITMSLAASDYTIVPIEVSSVNSVIGLKRVVKLITAVKKNINPDVKFLRTVMNRGNLRTTVVKQIIEILRSQFSNRYFDTIIPQNTSIQKAEFLKRTIFEYDQQSHAAKAYRNLAKEFLESIDEIKTKQLQ